MLKKLMSVPILFALTLAGFGQSAADPGPAANREYAAVFSRSALPCSADFATAPYLQCMSEELATIESHLEAFVQDLRGLTDSKEELDAFNQADARWRAYRDALCTLPDKRYTGTIRGPMSQECRWTQDRAYMEQLNTLFVLKQHR